MSEETPDYQTQRHAGRRASDIRPEPQGGDLSTWSKAKDVVLMGICGLLVFGVVQVLGKLAEIDKSITAIRVDLGIYQANEAALDKRVAVVEGWAIRHDQEDKAKFQVMARGR